MYSGMSCSPLSQGRGSATPEVGMWDNGKRVRETCEPGTDEKLDELMRREMELLNSGKKLLDGSRSPLLRARGQNDINQAASVRPSPLSVGAPLGVWPAIS